MDAKCQVYYTYTQSLFTALIEEINVMHNKYFAILFFIQQLTEN